MQNQVPADPYLDGFVHLCRRNPSTTTLRTGLFSIAGGLIIFIINTFYIEIPVLNAKSVEPDQMLHSDVSDLSLHCLPVTLFWASRLKWVYK